jgi:2-succinyl-5-enolpyruvyl-6-hydroxy-3-cyclohexene-1-carboxylate synthase
LATLLASHGVKRAVLSPGSRNVPLLVAVSKEPSIETEVVVDERSAAFMALGMASISGCPVALVCTSGTALLNYAPAVAEAYYRHIPLVVVSADRPHCWIDQDDSQTIRQQGALASIVKASYDISADAVTPDDDWYANRVINDALINATTGCKGPVHINMQINEPLGNRLYK